MNLKEIFFIFISVCLILFGSLMCVGFIAGTPGKGIVLADIPLALLMGVAPAGAGVFLWRHALQSGKARKQQLAEKELLKLAHQFQGRLSIAQVVAHTHLGVEQAEQMLNRLQEKGIAEIRVADNGVIFYEFSGIGFLPADAQ